MSLLMLDSIDHYSTSVHVAAKWDSSSLITSVRATDGRFGGGCIELDAIAENITLNVPDLTTIVMGGVVRIQQVIDGMSTNQVLFAFVETPSISHITVGNNYGRVQVSKSSGSGAELAISNDIHFLSEIWHHIECRVFLHATLGTIEVLVDGILAVDLTNQNTINGGVGICDHVQFRTYSGFDVLWDDLYVDDSTLHGDHRIDYLAPDGDGNYTEIGTTIPAAPATHYTSVNDVTPDDDTSYNNGTSVNQRDTFTMGNLFTIPNETITAIQQVDYVRHDGSATNFRQKLRISATDYDGSSQALPATYSYLRGLRSQDPNAGPGDWVASVINGMESGYEEL